LDPIKARTVGAVRAVLVAVSGDDERRLLSASVEFSVVNRVGALVANLLVLGRHAALAIYAHRIFYGVVTHFFSLF